MHEAQPRTLDRSHTDVFVVHTACRFPCVWVLQVGQAVAVNGASAFTEYGMARERLCTPVPVLGPEAAALAVSGLTAICALEVKTERRADDTRQ